MSIFVDITWHALGPRATRMPLPLMFRKKKIYGYMIHNMAEKNLINSLFAPLTKTVSVRKSC